MLSGAVVLNPRLLLIALLRCAHFEELSPIVSIDEARSNHQILFPVWERERLRTDRKRQV